MVKEIDLSALGINPQPTSALPPAGYQRDELLKERQDNLEEAAETVANAQEVGAIPHDHDALNPDRNREIQQHIHGGHLSIGANHPYLKVKWVNWKNQDGWMIWQAKEDGWQVATVQDFPEAKPFVKEDNTIRVADVLLMCIRMDEHYLLEERDKKKRLRQQYGVEAEIHDLARKTNAATGREVFKNVQTPELSGVSEDTLNIMEQRAARKNAARKVAAHSLGNKLKSAIPGVPVR